MRISQNTNEHRWKEGFGLPIGFNKKRGGSYILKRATIILLALLLIVLPACSKKSDGPPPEEEQLKALTESGMPIAKEKMTLKFFAGMGNNTLKNWNDDILIWKTYEDMTNIKIEWEQVEPQALEERRGLSLVDDNLPHAYYAANFPTTDIYKYGQTGAFLELNDLIDKYAPNLKKLMDENPEIRRAITFPDGKIYSLPVVHDPNFTSVRVHPLIWYNSELLDKYGMDVPTTTDEFYAFLKKVQEEDPDITPYGSHNATVLINMLRGAFGVGNNARSFIDKDPDTGKLRFYPITDRYKELLEYVHKLYSEKLIDQSIYNIDWATFLNNGAQDKYAVMVFYAPEELFGKAVGEKYVGGIPLKGPHGDQKWTQFAHPVGHIGKFVITNQNPNPIATMRWVDYWYSDEGSRLFYMGVEGETYEVVDGKYKYLDKITNSAEGLTKEQEIVKYLGWIGLGAPGILMEAYFDGSEASDQAVNAAKLVEPYLIDEPLPPFTYTEEETKRLSVLASDIEKYVNEMQDKFVTGSEPFSKWDTFVEEIKKMGLDEYMEIQQAAYDRYMKN